MQISKRGIRVIRTVVQIRRASCVVPKEAANLIMKDNTNPLNVASVGLNAVVGKFGRGGWSRSCEFLKSGFEILGF